MKEEPASSSKTGKRTWIERLLQGLSREPRDREQLVEILHDAEQRHLFDADALEMIEGVLEVSDMEAREIMVPRSQMVVIEVDHTPETILPLILESGHSRFPVVGKNRDEILGLLHAKDLLNYFASQTKANQIKEFDLRKFLRKPVFVPESKRLDMLLKEFRQRHIHIAIVVDEYGGAAGLITMEDILECIVGEIEDEFDKEEDSDIIEQEGGSYLVNALIPIGDFNEYFDTDFSTDEFTTIAGLLTQGFGHLPTVGESITLDDFNFEVLHADNRRISQLRVTRIVQE